MATPKVLAHEHSPVAPTFHSSMSVKVLSESPNLKSIPSNYIHSSCPEESHVLDAEDSILIPIIDFSQLTSDHSDHRLKAIQALGKACEEWGFFMVVNHGIPESLIKAVIDVTDEFFNMGEEDKKQFEGKDVLDPIRCGTSFNSSKEKAFFWRDFLKVFVHPQFHCPSHPQAFSRKVAKKILGAISESLGLDECAINNALALDSMFQIFIGNYYPRCPQPELVMGLPPHSDHGLLTLLIQNGVGGLQIMHEQKWIDVNALPNSLLVNTADALEIFSNGKYKSVMHRAVVNNKEKRISIAMAHGPSPETVVRPASQLVERVPPAAYRPIKYKEYIHLQQSNQLDGKSCLDHNSANVAPMSHSSSATVKLLSESPDLNSIPFNYVHSSSYEESPDSSDAEDSSLIPVIDFSQLTSNHNDQKSKAIQALGKACEEWGFFMVVNHGIPESLIKAVIDVTNEFFNMGEEDKKQFEGKDVLDPIRCGTSFNSSKEKAFFWRDFLKVFVHPQFHCPSHPQAFSEVMSEYCENSRKVAKEILGAISESLGLEECAMNNAWRWINVSDFHRKLLPALPSAGACDGAAAALRSRPFNPSHTEWSRRAADNA
nr:protein DMR6-LIKE OXYGENASE 2-like [Ipomoea batatas]